MVWKPFKKHHCTDMVYTIALIEGGGEVVHSVTMLRFEKAKGRFYDACNNMTFQIGDNRLLGWKPTPSRLDRPAFGIKDNKIRFERPAKIYFSVVAIIAVIVGLLVSNHTGDPLDFVFVTALVIAMSAMVAFGYQYYKFGDPWA